MTGRKSASDLPVILFGAFDRHNFGDRLLGELANTLLRPRPVVFAAPACAGFASRFSPSSIQS